MDGKSKSCEFDNLTKEIRKYANEYQTKKIKYELRDGWKLIHYSRYTRGFYVSFKLTLQELVYEAEKRRKSFRQKKQKEVEKEALKRALKRLEESRP